MATHRRSRRKSIAGNITDVQKRLRYLETRPAPSKLASKVVVSKNIAPRAVEQELIADGAITRRSLTANAVGTTQIEASAITQSLMATDSVGTSQIIQDSVTANEIAPGTITSTEMGADSVTSTQIQNGSVGTDELAGGIPDSKISGMSASKLIGEVQNSQIAGIEGSKIIGGIQGSLIVDGTVGEAELATGSVTNNKIGPGAVTSGKIGFGAVNNQGLGDGAVLEARIFDGAVTESKIRASAVTRLKIPVGEIQNYHIADVAGSKITGAGSISPSLVSGLSSVLTTASVSGTGISRTFSSSGNYRSLDITINAGTGANQLAIGNHTHTATTVAAHTHSATLSMNSLSISGGAHGHVGQTGSHSHGVTPTGGVSVGGVIVSTMKLKQDISDFMIQDPKNILNLKMKRYKYKNSVRGIQNRYNREWMYGYIAEEVQDLGVEQILAYDKNGDPNGIDYGLLSTLVLELVKVQQTEIDSLKEEIQRLKDKI